MTLHAVQVERSRRSLSEFVKHAWEVLNPGRTLEWAWYLDAICLHLEAVYRGQIRRLAITQPPNTLKSTITSVCWPAWVWINDPKVRFLCAANDGPLATRDAVAMRDLVSSSWYQDWFRPAWTLKSDQDQKTWFGNTAGGHRISYSVSAKVTGKKGDILLVDDANDAKKVRSPVERQSVIDWHDYAFSGRMADEKNSPEVVVGQRLHKQDLIGHLLAKGGWQELRLSEEYNPERHCTTYDKDGKQLWTDPRINKGEWLRPKRFAEAEKLDAISRLTIRGYNTQHNEDPQDAEGSMFKRENFKLAHESPRFAVRVRYWDKAATDDGGCFTVGVLMAKDQYKNYWVEDVVYGQWSALQRDEVMMNTAKLDKLRDGRCLQVIEQEPGSSGKDVAESTIRNFAGFEIYADKVTGAKEERALPLSAQVEARNVTVLERAWTSTFIDYMVSFPSGEVKDFADAASGAFNRLATLHASRKSAGIPNQDNGMMAPLPDEVYG